MSHCKSSNIFMVSIHFSFISLNFWYVSILFLAVPGVIVSLVGDIIISFIKLACAKARLVAVSDIPAHLGLFTEH